MKTSFKFCCRHVRGTSLQTTSGRRARDLVQGQVFARHASQWPGSPGSCVACPAPLALVVMTSRGREDVRAKLRSLPIVKAPVASVRPVTLVGPSIREALQLHFVAARDVLQNWRSTAVSSYAEEQNMKWVGRSEHTESSHYPVWSSPQPPGRLPLCRPRYMNCWLTTTGPA